MASPRRRTARLNTGSNVPQRPERGTVPGAAPTLRERLRYSFDNTMSRGTPALVAWLAVITVVLVAVFTLIVAIGGLAPEEEDGGKPGSFVIEHDHTLILGWSETVYTILAELAIANESERDPVVVIMSDRARV